LNKFILNCKIRWAQIKSIFEDHTHYIINLNSHEYIYIDYGKIIYYKGEKIDREGGPAIEYINAAKSWYIDGKLNRVDGPAREFVNGDKVWYYQGKLHRIDGPAVEGTNSIKYWYYQGQQINCKTQQEFEKLIKLRLFW